MTPAEHTQQQIQALIADGQRIDVRLRQVTAELRQFAITGWNTAADQEITNARQASTPTEQMTSARAAAEYRARATVLAPAADAATATDDSDGW